METSSLVSGKPAQTIAEYTEAQKRLLFRNETNTRAEGLKYLAEADCLPAAIDSAKLLLEHLLLEVGRREFARQKQLALDFGVSAPAEADLLPFQASA